MTSSCKKYTLLFGEKKWITYSIEGLCDGGTVGPMSASWVLSRNAKEVSSGTCVMDIPGRQVLILLEPEQRGRHYLDVTLEYGAEVKTERVFVHVV